MNDNLVYSCESFISKHKDARAKSATRRPVRAVRRLGDAARPRAGGFLDGDCVRRRVVSGKVVERDTLRSFATDGLLQNGTQLGGSCLDCQLSRTSMAEQQPGERARYAARCVKGRP